MQKHIFPSFESKIPKVVYLIRFSVHEFYSSLFKPLLEERLDFVQNLLKIGSDGVEELLKKVEEKKGNDGTISKTGNMDKIP